MSGADFDPLFQAAGAQYGVDPMMLKALATQESSLNPGAVNPASGAAGLMGFTPATAKAYGINPLDPQQAIPAAAQMFAENLKRFGGNVEQAVAAHFAGPDQKLWGPKTDRYVSDVANKFAAIRQSGGYAPAPQAQEGAPSSPSAQPDDIDAMLAARAQGKSVGAVAPAASPAVDPIDAMLAQRAAGQQIAGASQAPTAQAPVNPSGTIEPGKPWQTPGAFVMGLGDEIKGGVQSLAHGGAWLANKIAPDAQFTKDLNAAVPQIDQTIASQEQQYQAQRQASGRQGADWGRLGGNLTGSVPLAIASPDTAGMGILGRTAVGAGMGAANALITPTTDPSQPYLGQKIAQAETGALVGGAAVPVSAAIGGAVGGVTDAARQRLAQAGVTMTPGQMLGGALQRTEDKLTSVPVLGDFIKNAQQRSVQSFNRAAYNAALEPIGEEVPKSVGVGSNAVAYVRQKIGDVYNSIQPRAQFAADQNFASDLATIRNDLAQNAPGTLTQFDNIVQNQITGKLNNGVMSGDQWGNTRSSISGIARNRITGNATPDDRVLADALSDLNDAVTSAVGRASPPDILPQLQRANAAYAQYKQIERAAGAAGASNNGNVFTGAQFANAVRNGSTAAQKSTNSGLNGQLAADATGVLGSKYPDSGTVGRSLLTLGLGAAAGHAVAPGVMIPAAAGIGLGSLPYTPYGQRLAQVLLMNRPAVAGPIGNAISAYGPAVGRALAVPIARGAQ